MPPGRKFPIVKHIRPHKLFDLVKGSPVVQIAMPSGRAAGGTTILETAILIAAARIVQAKRVFEFGTFMGANTLNLALSVPDDGEVFTLDLADPDIVQHKADEVFAKTHLAADSMIFSGLPEERKIRRLTGNSRTFDFSPWHDSIDLSFIDGGHDLETVRADTKSAFAMSRHGSAIAWHDYGNADYPELTAFLDLSRSHSLVHIEDTMLCFWFFNTDAP